MYAKTLHDDRQHSKALKGQLSSLSSVADVASKMWLATSGTGESASDSFVAAVDELGIQWYNAELEAARRYNKHWVVGAWLELHEYMESAVLVISVGAQGIWQGITQHAAGCRGLCSRVADCTHRGARPSLHLCCPRATAGA